MNLTNTPHGIPQIPQCLARHAQIKSMTIGEYLRALRHEAGFTQADVARALGVGQPAVAKLEALIKRPCQPELEQGSLVSILTAEAACAHLSAM